MEEEESEERRKANNERVRKAVEEAGHYMKGNSSRKLMGWIRR